MSQIRAMEISQRRRGEMGNQVLTRNRKMTLMPWRSPTKKCVALVLTRDILIYWILFVAGRHFAFENCPIYEALHHLSEIKGQTAETSQEAFKAQSYSGC
jgi:hypothetical protein